MSWDHLSTPKQAKADSFSVSILGGKQCVSSVIINKTFSNKKGKEQNMQNSAVDNFYSLLINGAIYSIEHNPKLHFKYIPQHILTSFQKYTT